MIFPYTRTVCWSGPRVFFAFPDLRRITPPSPSHSSRPWEMTDEPEVWNAKWGKNKQTDGYSKPCRENIRMRIVEWRKQIQIELFESKAKLSLYQPGNAGSWKVFFNEEHWQKTNGTFMEKQKVCIWKYPKNNFILTKSQVPKISW